MRFDSLVAKFVGALGEDSYAPDKVYMGEELDALRQGLEYAQSMDSAHQMEAATERCRVFRDTLDKDDAARYSAQFLLGSGLYELGRLSGRRDPLTEAIPILGEVAEERCFEKAQARCHQAAALLELGRLSGSAETLERACSCFRHAVTALGKFHQDDAQVFASVASAAAAVAAAELRGTRQAYLRAAVHLQASLGFLLEAARRGRVGELTAYWCGALAEVARETGLEYAGELRKSAAKRLGLEENVELELERSTRRSSDEEGDAVFVQSVYLQEILAGCMVGEKEAQAIAALVRDEWGLEKKNRVRGTGGAGQ